MKTCSYCGQEYPDNALVCTRDKSPLVPSKAKPSTTSSRLPAEPRPPITIRKILAAGGFAVLAGFSGFGVTYLAIALYARHHFSTAYQQLDYVADRMPVLVAGGIIGFVAGLLVSNRVVKTDPKTAEKTIQQFVGRSGLCYAFLGMPVFIMALLMRYFERLLQFLGTETGVYAALGIFLVIIAVSLFLFDRIPAKLGIPIGIVGWLLTLTMIFLQVR